MSVHVARIGPDYVVELTALIGRRLAIHFFMSPLDWAHADRCEEPVTFSLS